MADYILTERSNLVAVANSLRDRTGDTKPLTLGDMTASVYEIEGEVTLQEKTVTPTKSVQNITPDTGCDGLSKVTVNAIPNTYVQPASTKAATTYTPSTSNQTISAGTYCSGAQTIEGDANLVADNIKSGVSIFGVEGSYEAGSGGAVDDYFHFNVFNNTQETFFIGATAIHSGETGAVIASTNHYNKVFITMPYFWGSFEPSECNITASILENGLEIYTYLWVLQQDNVYVVPQIEVFIVDVEDVSLLDGNTIEITIT